MNAINNEHLEAVTGGNEILFFEDGRPVCPICGLVGIELVESDAYIDTYRCRMCGQLSTHPKKSAAQPVTACPVCGCAGEGFRLVRTEHNMKIMKCSLCGHETQVPID